MAGGSEGNRRELEVLLVLELLEVVEGHWANGRHSLAGGLASSPSSSISSSSSIVFSGTGEFLSKPMIWAIENWSLVQCLGEMSSHSTLSARASPCSSLMLSMSIMTSSSLRSGLGVTNERWFSLTEDKGGAQWLVFAQSDIIIVINIKITNEVLSLNIS